MNMTHLGNLDPSQMKLLVEFLNSLLPEPKAIHGYTQGDKFIVTSPAQFQDVYTASQLKNLVDKHNITLCMMYDANQN